MHISQNIEINPAVMMGKPCIRGTRIAVHQVVQMIAGGDTVEDIIHAYPHISKEQVLACLQYAADVVSDEIVIPRA